MSVTQNIAPLTISFSNTSQGESLTYLWNFGDGTTSVEENPTHTFGVGTWEVTLTVTNENGTDTSSAVIVATQQQQTEQPPAGFSANDGPPPAFRNNQQNNNQQNNNQQNNNQQNNNQQPRIPAGFSANDGPPSGVL